MIVGFTGTRRGMTKEQKERVTTLLKNNKLTAFHHGDCLGSDQEAHTIARILSIPIFIHPPIIETYRAFCKNAIVFEQKDYPQRNRNIVELSDLLIATPNAPSARPRSGTWYTIKYALLKNHPVIIIFPNGKEERANMHLLAEELKWN